MASSAALSSGDSAASNRLSGTVQPATTGSKQSTSDLSSGATSLEKRLMARSGTSTSQQQKPTSVSSSASGIKKPTLPTSGSDLLAAKKQQTSTSSSSQPTSATVTAQKRKKTLWEPDSDSEYDLLNKAKKVHPDE